jgi:hypothetical protein
MLCTGLMSAGLGDAGAKAIASAVKVNSTLRHLNLHCNNIKSKGVVDVADALCSNATLTSLELGSNHGFGLVGAQALADALQVNTTMRSLMLGGAGIGDCGAHAFAKLSAGKCTLTELYMSRNEIADTGLSAIAQALKVNQTLTSLMLCSNKFGSVGTHAMVCALEACNFTLCHMNGVEGTGHLLKRNQMFLEDRYSRVGGPCFGLWTNTMCTVYCVLCTVCCVLWTCTVYCVLCTVYCVPCTVY